MPICLWNPSIVACFFCTAVSKAASLQDEAPSTHPTQMNSRFRCTNVKTQTQAGSPTIGSGETQSNWYLMNTAALLVC